MGVAHGLAASHADANDGAGLAYSAIGCLKELLAHEVGIAFLANEALVVKRRAFRDAVVARDLLPASLASGQEARVAILAGQRPALVEEGARDRLCAEGASEALRMKHLAIGIDLAIHNRLPALATRRARRDEATSTSERMRSHAMVRSDNDLGALVTAKAGRMKIHALHQGVSTNQNLAAEGAAQRRRIHRGHRRGGHWTLW